MGETQDAARTGAASLAFLSETARTAARAAARGRTWLRAAFDGGYRPLHEASGPAFLELEDLSAGYGDRLAIEGVSGRFDAGTLTAVVGPNGAGKSTLLAVLAGLLLPRSGTYRLQGLPPAALGFLPQTDRIDRDYPISVLEFAALGRWPSFGAFRTPPYSLLTEVIAALQTVGMHDAAEVRISDLSVGQFRRVLFARLIVQGAPLLLLDEPFAAIDEATTADLLGVLQKWHRSGRTIVAVMHDLDLVRATIPATMLLAGRVVAWGETAAVMTSEQLARASLSTPRNEPKTGLLRVVPL